jgi:hypothetical protein
LAGACLSDWNARSRLADAGGFSAPIVASGRPEVPPESHPRFGGVYQDRGILASENSWRAIAATGIARGGADIVPDASRGSNRFKRSSKNLQRDVDFEQARSSSQ